MLALRLPETIEDCLAKLAKETGSTKSFYVKQALEEFLEDKEDYLLAMQALAENNSRLTLAEVRRLIELAP